MMRLLLPLLAFAGLAACAESAADRADWPEPAPALWQVAAADGAQGWLFGTVHALPQGVEWRSRAVDQAFAGSGMLVVEIADLENSRAASAALDKVVYSQGLPPLLERLPGEDRRAVRDLLAEAGMPESDFDRIETWGAALMLAGAVRQGDSGNGVDRALIAEAKEVFGLEGFTQQFAVFDGLPARDQAYLLAAVAREAGMDEQERNLRAWLAGDMAALERSAMRGMLADPELREALMSARNRAWAQRVADLVEEGRRPFVAVGAAHMLTGEGLPALLEEHGLKVTRIQ